MFGRSYFPNKFGISPIVRIVFISYTKASYVIWLSENIKTADVLSLKAHYKDHYFIFYLKSFNLNPFEAVIWHKLYFAINVASFVKEWRPAPPYPTNIPWPFANLIILLILHTYDIASSNRVIFMADDLNLSLNSLNFS